MVENILSTIIALLGTLGVSFVVEKSPIKINPLSLIKKFLVGDLCEKIDNMDKKVVKIDEKVDKNENDRIKETVLTYRKLMKMGLPLSDYEYQYLCKVFDKYQSQGGNSFVADVMEEIKEMYHSQEENACKN